MIRFVNDFLSIGLPNQVSPPDPIIRKYNSNGHRAKDVENLDTSNYILFGGCSHTEGYGLEVEEIYTHHVAKEFNIDYYNMGVGGSGCDVMFYNLMTWLYKYEHKPKLILCQWSFPLRYARFHDDKDISHVQTEGSWSESSQAEFSILGQRIGYFPLRTQLYYNIIKNVKIPVVHVTFHNYNNKILKDYIPVVELDKARDNMHCGPLSHTQLARSVITHIKQKNLLV